MTVTLTVEEVRRVRRVTQELGSMLVGVMPLTPERLLKASKEGADVCKFLIKKEVAAK